jgi:Mor family transcriptional regulator
MKKIRESDLIVMYLSIVRQYSELFELYGLISEFSICENCGHDNKLQFKLFKEILEYFGGISAIKIPKAREMVQATRDITIWKGLQRCKYDKEAAAIKAAEYSKEYEMTLDNVYKIRDRVQKLVDKFLTLDEQYRKRKMTEDGQKEVYTNSE